MDALVRALRDLIAREPGLCYLPPVRSLARDFRVRPATVVAALRRLGAAGAVEYAERRRVHVRGRPVLTVTPQVRSRPRPAERAWADMRDRIRAGDPPTGQPLPKRAELRSRYGLSAAGCRAVLAALERASWVHRRGSRFYAGSGTSKAALSRPATIFILSRRGHAWSSLFGHPRYAALVEAFGAEAQRHGVSLRQALSEPRPEVREAVPIGKAALARALADHGSRALGVFIAEGRTSLPEVGEWIAFLAAKGVPAVWLDRDGAGGPGPAPARAFRRCAHREEDVARAALRALRDLGHRRVLYPYDEEGWATERLASLRREAARMRGLAVDGRFCDLGPMGWVKGSRSELSRLCLRLVREGPPALARAWGDLASAHPRGRGGVEALVAAIRRYHRGRAGLPVEAALQTIWAGLALAPALLEPEYTAILAPNDRCARALVLPWLARLGMRVPEDFSVLSFDHEFRRLFLPLSTVDFGYGPLGYKAFHFLLGDLPGDGRGRADLYAKPEVIHHGSLGPPRPAPAIAGTPGPGRARRPGRRDLS